MLKLRVCSTYCCSTTTRVAWTRFSVLLYVQCFSEIIRVNFYVTNQLSAFMCTLEKECINKLAVTKVYGKTVDGRCATFDCLSLCFKMDQVKMTRSNKLCSHFEYTSPILWNLVKIYMQLETRTLRETRGIMSPCGMS